LLRLRGCDAEKREGGKKKVSAEGSIMSGLQRISRAAIIINIMGRVACNAEMALSQENLNYIRFLCWKCQI